MDIVRLNLKLAVGATQQALDKLLAKAPGIQSAIQTFPDEPDEELSRLYVLEVSASESEAAITALNKHSEIEYIEPAAARRISRK